MAFKDHYTRNCKWCSQRLVMGLCDDDKWRAFEVPARGCSNWAIHQCPKAGSPNAVDDFFRGLLSL
ncbi:MAG: hypothetical protein CMA11_01035 [Euryarchaeota archaeon]|nr:hypothetical protein [Euryarchaeota archaeon]